MDVVEELGEPRISLFSALFSCVRLFNFIFIILNTWYFWIVTWKESPGYPIDYVHALKWSLRHLNDEELLLWMIMYQHLLWQQINCGVVEWYCKLLRLSLQYIEKSYTNVHYKEGLYYLVIICCRGSDVKRVGTYPTLESIQQHKS